MAACTASGPCSDLQRRGAAGVGGRGVGRCKVSRLILLAAPTDPDPPLLQLHDTQVQRAAPSLSAQAVPHQGSARS